MKWTTKGRANDPRGFTLVELLAVMAIIGVLAAIVIPTVSGTRDAGQDAQAKQDASTIENAANEKFSNGQNLAQVLSTETATTTAQINGVTPTSTPQIISSRWAERFLTATTSATYLNEFPSVGGLTDGTVINVIVTDLDGNAITGSGLMSGYTAIDVDLLEKEGYMTQVPSSATKVVTVGSYVRAATLAGLMKHGVCRGRSPFAGSLRESFRYRSPPSWPGRGQRNSREGVSTPC